MTDHGFSMPAYFQQMPVIGAPCQRPDAENAASLKAIEEEIAMLAQKTAEAGRSDESLNKAGQMTAAQRVAYLTDPGCWLPLNSIFDPADNDDHSTAIIKGLGRIRHKWCVVVASDNKKLAGAWVPGQSENLLRASDTAKMLRIPLVYILNCSGVKMDVQEQVYPNRRYGGTPFYRNAQLQQLGIPVIVGIYGINPAGGGYHGISPGTLIAHEKASIAVGGSGIVGGMNPKGYIDEEGALAIIEAMRTHVEQPPGSVSIHYNETGFFREVYGTEEGVLAAIKKYVNDQPGNNPDFFRIDAPKEPQFNGEELYDLLPLNPKRPYHINDILGRLFDNSEFWEFKPGYGPEIIAGLAKASGLLVGVIANRQGLFMQYPEYDPDTGSVGIGGKL